MVVFLEDPVRCSHDVPLIIVIRLAAGGVVFEVRVSSSGFKSGFVELNVLVCYYFLVAADFMPLKTNQFQYQVERFESEKNRTNPLDVQFCLVLVGWTEADAFAKL